MEFAYDGGGLAKGGTATLYVDGAQVGEGRVDGTVPMLFSADETTDLGSDTGTPVSDDYRPEDERVHRPRALGADRRGRGRRGPRPPDHPGGADADRDGSAVAGATLQEGAPARQQGVDAGGADDRLRRQRQARGRQHERARLRAAEAAVERDQLLEGAALVQHRVVERADHDVRDVREAVGAQQVPRARWARTPPAGRPPRRAPRPGSGVPVPPSATAPCSSERTSSQPTWGCARSAGSRAGWRASISSMRQPPRLLQQVDQPEVAGAEHEAPSPVTRFFSFLGRARACPVASPIAWPTIEAFSSPVAISPTLPASRCSWTRSSSP